MSQMELEQDLESGLDQDGVQGSVGATRQFVTFTVAGEVFGVDMAPVHEIIRVPEVVRVPLAPATLDGLANLRGKILPIISLRRIFGFDERAWDDATRAVVIDQGQPLGFVVDHVSSVVSVDESQIEGTSAISATVDTDLLSGLLKNVGGHAMVMVLDFARLIAREFASAGNAAKVSQLDRVGGADESAAEEADSDELQLVSFEVAGQEYAIAIEQVQEIVQVPADIVHVPRSAPHVLGVMTLRSRLLPLVSLRRMFSLEARAADDQSRIVVVALDGMSVGIVTDRVNEVLRVARDLVDPLPALLARQADLADIAQICRLDKGARLVSIVAADKLFQHSGIVEAMKSVQQIDDRDKQDVEQTRAPGDALDDEEQIVVFRLGNEEFGVAIDSVQEIVRVPELLTQVPRAPAAVEGVINLRGAVLPVVDLRRRLGLAGIERSDRQRIMVFLIGGVHTGFIVDSVSEVLKVPKSAIEPAPRLSSNQASLLSRMANLEKQKRMVQLLEAAQLMQGADLDAIRNIGH